MWVQVCQSLNVGDCFGQEMSIDQCPGEWWAEISEDGIPMGMTWVRRWLRTKDGGGLVLAQGRAMLPDHRHGHRSKELRRPVFDAIWAAYPEAATIIGVAYTTNPISVGNLDKNYPRIGCIPAGDRDLILYLLERRP